MRKFKKTFSFSLLLASFRCVQKRPALIISFRRLIHAGRSRRVLITRVVYLDSYNQGSHSDWKTWKNGKAFSSQGILNRLEKSGKTTQNTGKLRKFQKKILCYFSMIFK